MNQYRNEAMEERIKLLIESTLICKVKPSEDIIDVYTIFVESFKLITNHQY